MPSVVVPKRLFKAWIEDWEYNCVFDKDPVAMQWLLHKYGGLRWLDDDKKNELVIADDEEMDYQGGRDGSGWCVIGRRPCGDWIPWTLHCVVDEIAEYEQLEEMNVEIVYNEELREANREKLKEEEEAKKSKSKKKKQQ